MGANARTPRETGWGEDFSETPWMAALCRRGILRVEPKSRSCGDGPAAAGSPSKTMSPASPGHQQTFELRLLAEAETESPGDRVRVVVLAEASISGYADSVQVHTLTTRSAEDCASLLHCFPPRSYRHPRHSARRRASSSSSRLRCSCGDRGGGGTCFASLTLPCSMR